MAAAEALLAYEPLQQLQHENFLLREENRRFQSEVRELLDWKDKALTHMASMAPARRRAAREVERAKQLQQQLRTVESSLKTRGALEVATTELETEREALQQRVENLKREKSALKLQSERRKRRADEAEAQLAAMGESFRLHLERLVALRENLDDTDDKSKNQKEQAEPIETTVHNVDSGPNNDGDPSISKINSMDPAAPPETKEQDADASSSASSPAASPESAALVAGLDAIAIKCLTWLKEHLAQSFARQQHKAAQYEAQHAEMKRLEEQVQEASSVPEKLAQDHAKQTRAVGELRREEMAMRLRLVAGEVRQYLRLVRGEIKRKFGYLPEAIAHAESWATIAEALELLLCQSRDRCIVRD
ncbi:hypothetical protein BBO99_00004725 [Phytophthora kernoviae]|uniref:Uncharacterized protein n=2 Tax=Phytophthora kernoviae TaxID=325452 RepID=A0A421GQL5_9STRA|nr:hypothetical protein G195_010893 [Phytophthora kernoviae 00238/432]KAG2508785.1 hypothetical protein JM18_009048 [Phytophthora kernoviae]KAG2529296.1 hypothetical protein JM16_001817 [Phytophthora kernoviae]RLN27076.1 hypothetical protein BBI17_002494 [Phytophthora kernoviae]RLN80143.1 hypothetical protein BBO99_00004725 [Phytophthora kernoviae]